MDGEPECADGSDECPSNRFDIFSSNYNLVGNVVFRTFLWIVTFFAIGANSVGEYHVQVYFGRAFPFTNLICQV